MSKAQKLERHAGCGTIVALVIFAALAIHRLGWLDGSLMWLAVLMLTPPTSILVRVFPKDQ